MNAISISILSIIVTMVIFLGISIFVQEAQSTILSQSVLLNDNLVNAKTVYDIKFHVTGQTTVKCLCKIKLAFPAGIDISGAHLVAREGGLDISTANRVITYDYGYYFVAVDQIEPGREPTHQPTRIVPYNLYLGIEIAGIVNPSVSGNYAITVSTTDDIGNVVDVVSAPFVIKQIINSQIANGAVTNNKITDGAVTSTKILDNSITSAKIATGAITGSKISGISKLLFAKCVTDISIPAYSNSFFNCSVPGSAIGDLVIATYNGNSLGVNPIVYVSATRAGTGIVTIYELNQGSVPVSSKAQEFSVIVFKTVP